MKRKRVARISSQIATPSRCPTCNTILDGVTGVELTTVDDLRLPAHEPHPGAITACVYCVTMLRWDDRMMLRKIPEGELAALMATTPSVAATYQAALHIYQQDKAATN
jgi:hypothetical protein